jgi:hypothetical protein
MNALVNALQGHSDTLLAELEAINSTENGVAVALHTVAHILAQQGGAKPAS